MSDSLSIGRLRVSQRIHSKDRPLIADYDLIIVAVSWETRNVTALQTVGGSSAPTLLIRFASGKQEVDAAKNQSEAQLKSLCPNHTVLSLEKSIEFEINRAKIEAVIRDRFTARGQPLHMLVDISCIPKSYLTFLCGLSFVNEYACRMDCLYSEGRYDLNSTNTHGGPLSVVSEGEWKSLQVPYLEASETFPAERDLLVVLGGEIGFSLPFIDRYEPRRLSVIFIKGGVNSATLGGSEKAAYAELTSEPHLIRIDLPIHDIVGVLEHADRFCRDSSGRQVIGLAIGSKAQSLALALAALDIENLEIVCRVPGSYSTQDVSPTGEVFFYSIEDRFEPLAYLDMKETVSR